MTSPWLQSYQKEDPGFELRRMTPEAKLLTKNTFCHLHLVFVCHHLYSFLGDSYTDKWTGDKQLVPLPFYISLFQHFYISKFNKNHIQIFLKSKGWEFNALSSQKSTSKRKLLTHYICTGQNLVSSFCLAVFTPLFWVFGASSLP